ncbi:putative Platelet-activating factor acetylhydrolase [Seiridium unicorne]|uniref:1-alkyl-2-acetylglycerophosphocholine esterase n=1 Tax=Seiridium unicorne TaxID=138068 RepID=A0ABR2VFG6_9PEZI
MRVSLFSWGILLGSAVVIDAANTAISPPTGPYNVSIKKLEIPYVNTGDPIAPNNVTTSFLATAFYPTSQKCTDEPRPYLDPATAVLWETIKNITAGSLANLTTIVAKDAPALGNATAWPTLIFGPGGWGPPTEVFTILLSDLASYGYVVFGLDHPYEQPFVRYPNGTGLYGLDIAFDPPSLDFLVALQGIRINETIALIDRLPLVETLLGAPLNKTHVGTFGHSIGGAAAVGAELRDHRIVAGINMDGEFYGALAANDSSVDVGRPVLLLGQETHDGSSPGEPTWSTFPDAQTGWWRRLNVNGTRHLDFSDETFWKEVTAFTSQSLGTIDGYRQSEITREIVRAFFDLTLKGTPEAIFDGPTEEWPEVRITGSGGGSTQDSL